MSRTDSPCDCDVIHAEMVENARSQMPGEDELRDLSDFFKVLGDSTRTKIISALEAGEMCVCDLASLIGMSKSATSHQLGLLRRVNLVKNRREGRVVFYFLADDHIRQIFETGLEHIREERCGEL